MPSLEASGAAASLRDADYDKGRQRFTRRTFPSASPAFAASFYRPADPVSGFSEQHEICKVTPMPRQNRVTPFGQIVATPERGTLMGNRGIIHNQEGRIRRKWLLKRWIFCVLELKGRRRVVMASNRYTELFSGDSLLVWTPGGYSERLRRSDAAVMSVLTPESTVAAIRSGFTPQVHPSASRALVTRDFVAPR